jgi:hypothetical protein
LYRCKKKCEGSKEEDIDEASDSSSDKESELGEEEGENSKHFQRDSKDPIINTLLRIMYAQGDSPTP